MTLHFHGTPITPLRVLGTLAGRCFCVSYAAPDQVRVCHEIGQSVMLDNGAFSFWKGTAQLGPDGWPGYYRWAESWLDFPTTWAVIPDVIDGTVEDNDRLLDAWSLPKGAPVWHMHEPLDRLKRLCAGYERVCVGSSGQYAKLGSSSWHRRMEAAMNAATRDGTPWLHMLRGMAFSGSQYPFASVDSTDVGRNHNRPQNNALEMALRWDGKQCPANWVYREHLTLTEEMAA